jgi:hypothetical protein
MELKVPQRERNKQFTTIDEKIRTDLLVHAKSVEKKPIHFDEFEEIKSILANEFGLLDMSLSEGIRWLYLRWLSVNNKIPVEIEKRKPQLITAADLEMTEEQFNIAYRKSQFYRNRKINQINGGQNEM